MESRKEEIRREIKEVGREESIEEEWNKMKERVDQIFGKMERNRSENNMRMVGRRM